MLRVDLTGVFLCAQEQAKQMISQSPTEGKIINTASMYGTIAGGNCSYNAAEGRRHPSHQDSGGGVGPVQHKRQLYQSELGNDPGNDHDPG